MNYIVVEKEEINSRCHRFCNPSIICADNKKDAEFFYNHEYYTRECKAIATITKHTDSNGHYVVLSPINDFWKTQVKTIQSLFGTYMEKYGRVRYVIKRS